jgi:hypothetical protein
MYNELYISDIQKISVKGKNLIRIVQEYDHDRNNSWPNIHFFGLDFNVIFISGKL